MYDAYSLELNGIRSVRGGCGESSSAAGRRSAFTGGAGRGAAGVGPAGARRGADRSGAAAGASAGSSGASASHRSLQSRAQSPSLSAGTDRSNERFETFNERYRDEAGVYTVRRRRVCARSAGSVASAARWRPRAHHRTARPRPARPPTATPRRTACRCTPRPCHGRPATHAHFSTHALSSRRRRLVPGTARAR